MKQAKTKLVKPIFTKTKDAKGKLLYEVNILPEKYAEQLGVFVGNIYKKRNKEFRVNKLTYAQAGGKGKIDLYAYESKRRYFNVRTQLKEFTLHCRIIDPIEKVEHTEDILVHELNGLNCTTLKVPTQNICIKNMTAIWVALHH